MKIMFHQHIAKMQNRLKNSVWGRIVFKFLQLTPFSSVLLLLINTLSAIHVYLSNNNNPHMHQHLVTLALTYIADRLCPRDRDTHT